MGRARASTNQQRVLVTLDRVGLAQEQLAAGKEAIDERFEVEAFVQAAMSANPNERNKVAAIERAFEVLVNALDELAARALNEGRRLEKVDKGKSSSWMGLAELGVIPRDRADALSEAREMRNNLGHHYPPERWELLHLAVSELTEQIDPFLSEWGEWVTTQGIFSFDG